MAAANGAQGGNTYFSRCRKLYYFIVPTHEHDGRRGTAVSSHRLSGVKLTGSVKPPQTNTDTFTHVVTFRSSPSPPQTAPAEIKVSAVTAAPTLLLH